MMIIEEQEAIFRAIRQAGVIAVVGISEDRNRPSYMIAQRLMAYNRFRLYLVNPVHAGKKILGQEVLGSLLNVKEHIDIVDVFRRPDAIEPIFEDALRCQAGLVWLQPGTEDLKVIERYSDRIDIVFNACLGVMAAGAMVH
ncbi:MAG: CoA-binding protein [Deltaproteobacteria bacterium]|jgi:hypothetical protein|nr:CoA-binding protein [Deltaproteobacteria bacterium]